MQATPLPVAGTVLTTTHDWGFIGFVIAILTLLMTIPLGVAATLLAPRVRDWWARRSLASIMKRKELLTATYEQLQKLHPRDGNYDHILVLTWNLGVIILFHLDGVIVAVLSVLALSARTASPELKRLALLVVVYVFAGAAVGTRFLVISHRYIDRAGGYVSPRYLNRVRKELETIESRISAYKAN